MLLTISFLCFTTIALLRWRIALAVFFFLLPSYLVRFSIGPISTTFLEILLLILIITWGIHERKHIIQTIRHTVQDLWRTHPSLCMGTLLFIIAATISVITSINTRAALGEWKAFYIEPILFALILITAFTKTKKQTQESAITHTIFLPLLTLGLITAMLSLYQQQTGWMVPWDFWENRNTYRITGWYGFPNGVGLFLAPLIPLALFVIATVWKNKGKKFLPLSITTAIISALFLLTAPFAILFAQSTGAIIGVTGGIGILLLCYKKTRIPAVILGMLGLAILIAMPATHPIKQELLAQDRSGQIRVDMWGEAVQYISEHPVVGAGLASYQQRIYPYRIDKWIEVFHHPHNIFLTMWMNLGLLGMIAFTWLLVWFIRVSLTAIQKKNNLLPIYLLASMTTWIITGFVDSPYSKNDWSILWWSLFALLLMHTQSQKPSSSL